MAAPTFQAAGTAQAGGAVGLTVPWPTHVADDIGILMMEGGSHPGLATANGFVQTPDMPQSTSAVPTFLDVYWCRATSASMSSPVTNAFTNHGFAAILTFRGCITTGNPWDVTSGGNTGALSDTVLAITGDITTVVDCLIVYIASRGFDIAGAQYSGEADATLTSLTERFDDGTATANGGGLGAWTGIKAAAGAYGPLAATLANLAADAFTSIALKPPVVGGAAEDPYPYIGGGYYPVEG